MYTPDLLPDLAYDPGLPPDAVLWEQELRTNPQPRGRSTVTPLAQNALFSGCRRRLPLNERRTGGPVSVSSRMMSRSATAGSNLSAEPAGQATKLGAPGLVSFRRLARPGGVALCRGGIPPR